MNIASYTSQMAVDAVILADDAAGARRVLATLPWRRLRSTILVAPAGIELRAIALDAGATFVPAGAGYGANCLAALAKLQAMPVAPDIVVFVPASKLANAAGVTQLIDALADNTVDVALAVPAGGHMSPTWLLSKFVSGVYARRVSSISGYYAIAYAALTALGMSASGRGWDVELVVRAMRLDLRLAEVPIAYGLGDGSEGAIATRVANAKTAVHGVYHVLRHLTIK